MKLIFAILCFAVVSNESLADKCEEDDIKECQIKVDKVITKLIRVQEAGKDSDNFCSKVEPEPKCIKDIPTNCKSDFPVLSVSVSKAKLYKSEFCGQNGEMYMDVAPCLTADNAVFKKCERKQVPVKEMMCELVDFMTCTAKFSKENCKNGEAYGNALEARMKIEKDKCRSGAGYLANSFWTFATTVLSALLIRNKMP